MNETVQPAPSGLNSQVRSRANGPLVLDSTKRDGSAASVTVKSAAYLPHVTDSESGTR